MTNFVYDYCNELPIISLGKIFRIASRMSKTTVTNSMFELVFFFLIGMSWASLAAFVGLAGFLIDLLDDARIYLCMFAAATVLVPTAAFLLSQESYTWLYALDVNAFADSRIFHFGNWILNATFFVGVALIYFSKRHLPPELHVPVTRICLWSLVFSTLWVIAGTANLFIFILFVSDGAWLISRFIFVVGFLAVSGATFRWLASIHRQADLLREQTDGELDKPRDDALKKLAPLETR